MYQNDPMKVLTGECRLRSIMTASRTCSSAGVWRWMTMASPLSSSTCPITGWSIICKVIAIARIKSKG